MGVSDLSGWQEVRRCEEDAPKAYFVYVERADDNADVGVSILSGWQEVRRCEEDAPKAYFLYVERADDNADVGLLTALLPEAKWNRDDYTYHLRTVLVRRFYF